MKLDQQQQAQHLYFQTDMSKSEIADSVGVSRRSLHYWVEQNNWDRLKKSAQYIPSFLAENCYQILGNLTEQILSEDRFGQPATPQEVNSLYKLTLMIARLKKSATLNENMETFASFTDHLLLSDPALAEKLAPHIDTFIAKQAAPNHTQYRPSKINDAGFIPGPDQATAAKNAREALLDQEDLYIWEQEAFKKNAAIPPAPQTQPEYTTTPKPATPAPSAPRPAVPTPPNARPALPPNQEPNLRGEAAARGKLPRILRYAA